MGLNRVRLGDLIEQTNERNEHNRIGIASVRGISIQKKFINTKAYMDGVSLTPYKVVRPGDFAYITVTSRNGEKVSFAFNDSGETFLVSSSYVVFRVARQDILNSTYLTMYFLRPEFDRFARFNSWGSARETFTWEDLCAMEIDLPPLDIQQKYVDVYRAMLASQASFERGLDDLKLTCDAALDQIKKKAPRVQTGDLLETVDIRNAEGKISRPSGINVTKRFMPSVASVEEENLKNYKIVRKGQFAYSSMQTGRDECIRIALHDGDTDIIVSPAYSVLRIKNESVLAEYVMTWFSRSESDRYGSFASDASIRANLDIERFFEIEIPLPALEVQRSIIEIYKAYKTRHKINGQLKALSNQICPILIKGSIEETQKGTLNGLLF